MLNIVGIGLGYLFGTATDKEIKTLGDKFTTVEDLVKNNHKVLEGLNIDSTTHTDKINEIIDNLNNVTETLNKEQTRLDTCSKFIYTIFLLQGIYTEIRDYSRKLREHIDEITLASKDIVTTRTISLTDLSIVITEARLKYGLKPIFNSEELSLYYSFMNLYFTPGALALRIPMQSSYTFTHYSFTPFPTRQLNHTIILKLDDTELLISHDRQKVALGTQVNLVNCKEANNKRICPANSFSISPRWDQNTCLEQLLAQKSPFQGCDFETVDPEFKIQVIDDASFIYNKRGVGLVTCNNEEPVEVHKHNIILSSTCEYYGQERKVLATNFMSIKVTRGMIDEYTSEFNITTVNRRNSKPIEKISSSKTQNSNQTERNGNVYIYIIAMFSAILVILCMVSTILIVFTVKNKRPTIIHKSAHP